MVKDRISKESLEHLALVEIRSHRGCEDVSRVEIESAPEKKEGTNWHIVGLDCRSENFECAARAVTFVHNKLRERYDLLQGIWHYWEYVMAMTQKARSELKRLVLEEMGKDRSCATLPEITIRTDVHGVWFVAPRDPAVAFPPAIQRAAVNAQIRLRPKYDLTPEDKASQAASL
jgi:hypothetical protein